MLVNFQSNTVARPVVSELPTGQAGHIQFGTNARMRWGAVEPNGILDADGLEPGGDFKGDG